MTVNFWGVFYIAAVAGTMVHALIPLSKTKGRQHVLGAEIIALSWSASFVARDVMGDPTPLVAYSMIDVVTTAAFLTVALQKKAVWAAICVILHAAMVFLHLAHFINRGSDLNYVWLLNSLFLIALLTINGAILVGRYEPLARMDRFVVHRLRGWTFSGFRFPRMAPG